jgi:hypothetical protein
VSDLTQPDAQARTRAIARDVLLEALGASATPFVPVPFVDDWMQARLLRRVATKVLDRHGLPTASLPRAVVDAYVKEGAPALGTSIAVGAARFIVRKVAIVLDVKKSYEVFGESIAFAIALDVGAARGWAHEAGAARLGGAMHRSLRVVGSGAIEALVRAGRDAAAQSAQAGGSLQLGDALGREIDAIRRQIEPILARELPAT